MTDIIWPPSLRQSSIEWRIVSNSEAIESPYSGQYQTASRPGDRFACHVVVANVTRAERRRLLALAARMRGQANRILIPDLAHERAGTFPTGEMLAGTDFGSASSWGASGSSALAVSDGALRCTVSAAGSNIGVSQGTTVAQAIAYAMRSLHQVGKGLSGLAIGPYLTDGSTFTSSTPSSAGSGYLVASGVVRTPGAVTNYPLLVGANTGMMAGDHVDLSFASMSRVMLADGGGNLLQRSNSLGTAPWSVPTGSATGGNGTAAPDGTLTDQYLQETDTTNREHYVSQSVTLGSAVAQDITATVYAHNNSRNWLVLRMFESTGNTYAYAWFNLSTGVVGTTSAGANWTNQRVTITPCGNGWYRCTHTARKTNAATTVGIILQSATGDGNTSYAGTTSSVALRLWEATLKADSLPYRNTSTTSAAIAAAAQAGSAIYVKGLPASQSGLLAVGDHFEVDRQLKRVTAPLDSDAAGLGYLQFEPALPRAIADNTPIIVHQPLCRMLMISEPVETARPGGISDIEFEFMQDLGS